MPSRLSAEGIVGVQIEQIMTREVVTVTPATSIQSAAKLMVVVEEPAEASVVAQVLRRRRRG